MPGENAGILLNLAWGIAKISSANLPKKLNNNNHHHQSESTELTAPLPLEQSPTSIGIIPDPDVEINTPSYKNTLRSRINSKDIITEDKTTSPKLLSVGPQGTEFQVNTYTNGDQVAFNIEKLNDGGIVIAWHGYGNGSDDSLCGIYAKIYNKDGTERTPDFQVNTYTDYDQSGPKIAHLGDGGFIIVWHS